MDNNTFTLHKLNNPHLTFTLIDSKFIPIEKTYFDTYGVYSIYRRDFYIKSNMKKCYVDTFIREVNVERYKLCPSSNGYSFRIKHQYLKDYITF